MDDEKNLKLLSRQVRDIQVQADKILEGDNSHDALESFSKYCSELKSFINNRIQTPQLREYAAALPNINHQRNETKLWHYLIWPAWWINLYKDYHAKNKTLQEISHARGMFATLELMIKGTVS